MKKWLLMIPCLLICCLLMIVPVSAAGFQISGSLVSGSYAAEDVPQPLDGAAFLTLYDNGVSYSVEFYVEPYVCSTSIDGVPALGISVIELCFDSEYDSVQITCFDDNYEPALVFCDFVLDYQVVEQPPNANGAGISGAVLGVFSAVGQWFVAQLGTVAALFVTVSDGVYHLTFFGIMTLVAIGLAVTLLIIRAVGAFLSMRR